MDIRKPLAIIFSIITVLMLAVCCEKAGNTGEVEEEEEEYVVVPLSAPGIHDATDLLAKYNIIDFEWDSVGDVLCYEILLDGEELPSTTETSLRLEGLADGDHCLQVKAIPADTTLFYDSEWSSFNFTIDKDKIKGFKFDFEILLLSSEEVTYRVTPGNLNATYDYGLIEKSVFDMYGDDGVRSFVYIRCIEPMLEFFEKLFLFDGVVERHQGVKPGVEYMIYAYGLKEDGTKDGAVTTSFQYITFTSPTE